MGRWHILPSLQPLHCVLSHFDYVQLIATPQTGTHQAPLSMEFSKQEYWSGLEDPSPGDLPNPRIKPTTLSSPALVGRFFTISTTWEAFSLEALIVLSIEMAHLDVVHLTERGDTTLP